MRFKKNGIIRDEIDIKTRLKLTVFPFLLIIFVLISLCAVDYSYYKYKEQQEIKKYNEIKKEEIKKMVSFINDKYDINFKEKDCIDYVEKDYSTRGFLPTTYNIPYIAVFKQNNETITVIDRKGFISDNRQLKDIHYIIGDYFTSITGINIEFADLGEYTVNSVLEYDFNKKITHENINKFIDIALKKEDFQLIFYVKDTVIKEDLISDLISKFNHLKSLTDDIEVYFYKSDEELLVKFDDNKVDNEEDKYETTPNNDDYDTEKESADEDEALSVEQRKAKAVDLYNDAVASYKKYLEKAPDAKDKDDINNEINSLEEEISKLGLGE